MYLSHYFNSCGGERWFDDTREFAAHLSHTRESRHRSIEKKVDETASREGISSGSAISFLEASMSRFEAWITHPTVPVGQISAYRRGPTKRENERNHKELRRIINDLGYSALLLKCARTNKSGEPSAEWSWCVIGRTGQAPNPVPVSEDELEQQMRELAGRYDQESFVVTKPSRKQVVLVSAEGGRRSIGVETTRLGVDAFHRVHAGNCPGNERVAGIKEADDKAFVLESRDHRIQELPCEILPISMPGKTRVFGPARFWRDGLAEDGREDLADTVDYFYSRSTPDLSNRWWPNTRKAERLLGHEIQDQIMERTQDQHALVRDGYLEEAKAVSRELKDRHRDHRMMARRWRLRPR